MMMGTYLFFIAAIWFVAALSLSITFTRRLSGTGWRMVKQARRNFVDVQTQEPLHHYFRLEAGGGWLIRHLGISEGSSPLLFPAICQPKNLETFDGELGLIRTNRPISNLETKITTEQSRREIREASLAFPHLGRCRSELIFTTA